MASPSLKSWRTAFLTLRDEALASPPPTSSQALLQSLIFSQNDVLVSAAADLPPHEATSDLMFFLELTKNVADGKDAAETYAHACHLIHDVSSRVCLEMNSFSWGLLLDFLEKMLQYHLKPSKAPIAKASLGNAARVKVVMEILEIMRFLENGYGRKCSLQESAQFVNLLLDIIACCNTELCSSCYSSGDPPNNVAGSGSKRIKYHCLWDCQTAALAMVGEALTKMGSSVSLELWQLSLEVLRKVMDALLSKRPLVEDSKMSRFYSSLLHCLHLVLSDVKGSLSEHVAGLVASLRTFFIYGLHNQSLAHQDTRGEEKDFHSTSIKSSIANSTSEHGRYRPPHLRRRERAGISLKSDSQSCSEDEASTLYLTSSDSEHSDSDGLGNKLGNFHSSKTRIAALLCVQDLCQADPKSLTAQWTMLLPTSDVLQPRRKHEPTLMTCLLFDPILKTRVAAATTLTSVLGAASPVFLQVAEYKESTKLGPFTSLSSSVGQMLLQLHAGILYLVQQEAHSGMFAPLFKSLMLLITATPYARMPGDLLPSVISSIRTRMIKGFPSRADHNGLMVIGLSCLGAAFSTSPPSLHVQKVLQEEISIGLVGAQGEERVLSMIIHLCERITNPTISLEALQVLRAVSHHYPSIMVSCWKRVSTTIEGLLSKTCSGVPTLETTTRPLKGNLGSTLDPLGERCITAAVKVLDECLRAISGFKGTEDVLDDRSLNSPFTSDCTRTKRISSAPSYGVDGQELLKDDLARDSLGSVEWCEAIDKHLPLILLHGSPMVRAASVTCFAGMTSSVFLSLLIDKQEFVLSSSISAALNDEVPSVRSAACRAIGVISCFPQISNREETLDKFIHAIEINANHSLASVRITACWALANVCDLLRHRADVKIDSQWIARLSECSLRLTKDGDKIKSNAVRALGNLARFVRFTSPPTAQDKLDLGSSSMTAHSICPCHQTSNYVYDFTSMGDTQWLGRMVQAFVSCVTTGNVKVQWNVCHALSNLFHNQTLKLQDMAWAPSVFSILLLLLRDSSNYKIRIQAAAALAVPVYRLDYGSSFSDVVQGLEHVLEDLGSEQISTSSKFKYSDALQKQLTAATLHVLGLISCSDHEALIDFLVKKASFFEHWLKSLCSSILDDSTHLSLETPWVENQKNSSLSSLQKKEMMSKAMKALHEFFTCNSQPGIAQRIENLLDCVC